MVEVLMPTPIVNRAMMLHGHITDHFNSSNAFTTVVNDGYLDDMLTGLSAGSGNSAASEADDSLGERVQHQVEWYFSDDNLRKDAFLMKHIARNKNGFVSLKLVASLRKIKSLTKDCNVVAYSIKCSQSLELNEDSTKVRRTNPAPDVDYSTIPRTIIITKHLDDNSPNLHKEYSRYGEISRVLVLHPGKAVPLYIKSCKSRFPCIGKEVCILVEYETAEMAKKAFKESRENWRQTSVVHLLSQKQEDLPLLSTVVGARAETVQDVKLVNKKPTKVSQESSRAYRLQRHRSPKNTGYGSDSGYSCASCSPSISPKSSPAPTRRFINTDSSMAAHTRPAALVAVIRNPLGPDGTKGFKLPQ